MVAQGEILNQDEDRAGTSWRGLRTCEVLRAPPQPPAPQMIHAQPRPRHRQRPASAAASAQHPRSFPTGLSGSHDRLRFSTLTNN